MKRLIVLIVLMGAALGYAQGLPATMPSTQPGVGRLPHIEVDAKHKTVRMECEALNIVGPLEFLCCVKGTNEYESVLRSEARPSHLHLALLMLGLKPGHPIEYDQQKKEWLPPTGPPLSMSIEFEKDGKTVTIPAEKTMRAMKDKRPMPPMTWVFSGSKILPDKRYAADATGYLVSIVNFELTPIDVPALDSSSNETLLWETNPDVCPPTGTKVTLIIKPAEQVKPPQATTAPKGPPGTQPGPGPIPPPGPGGFGP